MEQKFDNAMRRQVYSIPELITQHIRPDGASHP